MSPMPDETDVTWKDDPNVLASVTLPTGTNGLPHPPVRQQRYEPIILDRTLALAGAIGLSIVLLALIVGMIVLGLD